MNEQLAWDTMVFCGCTDFKAWQWMSVEHIEDTLLGYSDALIAEVQPAIDQIEERAKAVYDLVHQAK